MSSFYFKLFVLFVDEESWAFFDRAAVCLAADENATTMRSLYYPPVKTAKENQIRCAEHSDYGSITLVFQGSDGLEVKHFPTECEYEADHILRHGPPSNTALPSGFDPLR